MTVTSLREKIRELVLRRVRVQSDLTAAKRAFLSVEQAPGTVSAEDKQIVLETSKAARQELSKVEGELSAAREELRRIERLSERPSIEARLKAARVLVRERNRLADEVQRFLEGINGRLLEMDEVGERLFALEREGDPAAIGPEGTDTMIFKADKSPSRLRPALQGFVRHTTFEASIRQPLNTQRIEESFAVLEAEAGRKLIERFERKLRELDELSNVKEEVIV